MSFAKDCATSRRDPPVLSTFERAGGLYWRDLSYVSGTSSRPLLGMTIGEAFDAAARQWAEKAALVVRHQHIRWTYAELAARVDAFAAGLLSCGLEPGDRIGIWAPNRAEWLIAQFATAKAGLILVNINPAYRSVELGYVLRKVKCRALITAAAFKSSDYLAVLGSVAPDFAGGSTGDPASLPDLRAVFQMDGPLHPGAIAFDEVQNHATPEWRQRPNEIAADLQCADPREIEEFLYGRPEVQDVQVFGVPDEKYGEELCAWIRLRDGAALDEEAVRAYCRGRIAHYKVPRHVRFVTEFPMTVTGKIQKLVMRRQMSEILGVREQETA